jgi:hypothetical protein
MLPRLEVLMGFENRYPACSSPDRLWVNFFVPASKSSSSSLRVLAARSLFSSREEKRLKTAAVETSALLRAVNYVNYFIRVN